MFLRVKQSRIGREICILLASLLLVSIIPMNIFADMVPIKYYSIEDRYSYEVATAVTSLWDSHANIELKIKNIGDQRIDNWHLTFETPYTIENIWNASILETDNNGTYTIRNNYYNQDIDIDSEVTIGMTLALGELEFENLSSWYLLNTEKTEVESDKYLVSYQEYSKWEGGYNGALILSSQEYVEDWSLTFDSEYEISSISNATIDVNEEGLYKVTNDGNTQNLSSNMLFLSIQGIPTENEFELRDVTMCSVGLAYTLTEDADDNGIVDYQDFINLQEGVSPVTPTPTVDPTITPVPTVTEEPTENPTEIPTVTPEPTITDIPDYDGYLDSDDDGLLNYEEDYYGTDKNNADSDGDLIDDFTEINIGYNPKDSDSDKNGIIDGEEDFDKDGITNANEIEIGSCLYIPDTDFDDINDYDELYVYGTDPNKEDSNDDGIFDGDALKLGLNPASSDSDNDGIPDKDEKTYQKIELQIAEDAELQGVSSIEVKGNFTNLITSTTTIEDMYGKDVYSSEIQAIVGGLVSIESSSDFDTATIIFHYDENEIGVEEDDLCILWYDEANGEYVMLDEEQVLDKENDTVSYVTTHFSEYMLISKTKWIATWIKSLKTLSENREKYQASGNASVKYLIAMNYADVDTNEYRDQTEEVFNTIIEYIDEKDILLMTYFNTYGYGYRLANKFEYSQKVNEMKYEKNFYPGEEEAWWGPDFTNLLLISTMYGGRYAEPSDKIVTIMITDAYDIDLDEAKEDYIYNFHEEPWCDGVIVVSLGNLKYLESDAFPCMKIDNEISTDEVALQDAFPQVLEELLMEMPITVNYLEDHDGDYLTDFEEETGHLLSNGTLIFTDPYDKFTDDDQLTDFEELGTRKNVGDSVIVKKTNIETILNIDANDIWYWDYRSDPTNEDTDGDDFTDDEDARPRVINPKAIYVFTNPDFYFISKIRCNAYLSTDTTVFFHEFYDVASFEKYWNLIGLHSAYVGYYFEVSYVVICTHGNNVSLLLDKKIDKQERLYMSDENMPDMRNHIFVSDLEQKKIDSLNLYACSCGFGERNLATDFLDKQPGIKQVIAADSSLNVYVTSDCTIENWFFSASVHIVREDEELEFRRLYDLLITEEAEESDNNSYWSLYLESIGIDGFVSGKYTTLRGVSLKSFVNAKGFKCFAQNQASYDLYQGTNEDVLRGCIYTTQYNYENNISDVLYLKADDPAYTYDSIIHDPVIN